jgi:hypothetical protein
MPDYQNGKIYSIRSYQTDLIYIGSSCQPLHKRLHEHKRHYKQWQNGKYNCVSSFEVVKSDDAYIELLENFPCNSKEELNKREGECIRTNECVNKRIEGRTKKEYYEDNKEKIAEKKKEYRENNKDQILEKAKEYYENNKEKIAEKAKEYRENNKEKIAEKYECECGGKFTYGVKAHHLKTQKHQSYLASITNS